MGEVLLAARLAERGVGATVSSAGLMQGGVPASPGSVKAMATRGLDLRAHRSRFLTPAMIEGADLVLGMGRQHVREVVLACPGAWPKAFTLKELVRRGEGAGPRQERQSNDGWLLAVGEGRRRSELLGEADADDVADPIGGPDHLYVVTADEIDDLLGRLTALLFTSD